MTDQTELLVIVSRAYEPMIPKILTVVLFGERLKVLLVLLLLEFVTLMATSNVIAVCSRAKGIALWIWPPVRKVNWI